MVKILRLFKENPLITISEIAEKIGITLKGVEWNNGV
ncbi:MAG: winged helix-turn-helix domain-containing protein [Candidatus Omnitrophota bacterium]|nr:winged helix-turn-helix domain-containing protein [Candidatus Omnitrophota bacterium]